LRLVKAESASVSEIKVIENGDVADPNEVVHFAQFRYLRPCSIPSEMDNPLRPRFTE